jgi:hypothetical protein
MHARFTRRLERIGEALQIIESQGVAVEKFTDSLLIPVHIGWDTYNWKDKNKKRRRAKEYVNHIYRMAFLLACKEPIGALFGKVTDPETLETIKLIEEDWEALRDWSVWVEIVHPTACDKRFDRLREMTRLAYSI